MTENKVSAFLETLAAAYAGNGQFKEAVIAQKSAIKYAGEKDLQFLEEMKAALHMYKKDSLYYK